MISKNAFNHRIPFFDIARFFAIFGVIAVHVGHNSISSTFIGESFNYGRFGVQLFFIISGATVFFTYSRDIQKGRPQYQFFVKRFFRIIPLFILMAIIYQVLDNKSIALTIAPWSGLNPSAYNNIEGGWSIWNEMYFYLLFPLYFKYRNHKVINVAFSSLLITISLLINFRILGHSVDSDLMLDFDYLNIFTQFVCFIVGVEMIGKNRFNLFLYVGLQFIMGITIKYVYFKKFLFVADYGALYWISAVALMCWLFVIIIKYFCEFFNIERGGVLGYLGRKTYTTYMIHFLVIRVLQKMEVIYVFEVQLLLVSLMSFLITIMIEKYTERIWVKMGYVLIKKIEQRIK